MKIEGPSKTGATSKTGKGDKARESDGSFGDYIAAGVKGKSAAAPTSSIAKVDVLLAVQGAEDPTERASRQRMQKRAEGVLHELDKIRLGLLTGRMTLGHVLDIADVVASHRERITDPKLTSILDEIDLRAQIEIAKMRRAMDSRH